MASSAASPAVEPGFLFMCSNVTFGECVRRSLLGESKDKLGLVQAVVKPSTPLLLLNFSRRVVYGPFWAAAAPALNIEPCAWEGGATNSRRRGKPESSGAADATTPYPVQVRMLRRGRVRSWSLREGMHLRAGKLTAAQTDELMQALKEGSVAAEADVVAQAPTATAHRPQPPLAPNVAAAAAAASTPTPLSLGAISPHTPDLSTHGINVIVDGPNVTRAYASLTGRVGVPLPEILRLVMQPLDVLGARVVLCGPRGWCTELRQQSAVPLAPELLIEAPGGKDDGIAIDWAIRNDAFIVTNDRYLEHLGQFPPGRSDAYLMKFAWSPNVDQTWSFALTDADKMRAYSMRPPCERYNLPQVVPAHTDSAIRSKGRGRGRGRGGRGLGLLPSAITSGSPAGGSISVAGQRERGGVVRLPVYRARPTSGPLVGAGRVAVARGESYSASRLPLLVL